mmetsp:Transcript_31246/g.74277  ORF Transcript_31246/g.74277 Transcript_31246/m.74277 type:complete len:260 (-) Transcript_31246:2000-2779(-)
MEMKPVRMRAIDRWIGPKKRSRAEHNPCIDPCGCWVGQKDDGRALPAAGLLQLALLHNPSMQGEVNAALSATGKGDTAGHRFWMDAREINLVPLLDFRPARRVRHSRLIRQRGRRRYLARAQEHLYLNQRDEALSGDRHVRGRPGAQAEVAAGLRLRVHGLGAVAVGHLRLSSGCGHPRQDRLAVRLERRCCDALPRQRPLVGDYHRQRVTPESSDLVHSLLADQGPCLVEQVVLPLGHDPAVVQAALQHRHELPEDPT